MWTLIIKLPHTEVKFYPEVNSNRFEISLCNRVLILFGKLPQWNHHVSCHVNGTTFQTGLSSLRVSCKRTLNEIYIVSKTVLYLNADADAVKAEMSMLRFPRGLLHVDELKFSLGRNFILIWNFFRLHEHFNQHWKQESFNRGWTQKHHLQYFFTSWYINEKHC